MAGQAPRHAQVTVPKSRTGFGRSARRRQACFRDASSTVSDAGRAPADDKGRRNGHLLAHGHEPENLFPGIRGDRGEGGAIDFFRCRGIPWWKSSRSGDDTGYDGPTRNMASSQVACVNFLLPLADIPGALACALRSIDDDVCRVVDISHGACRSSVEFEWIGVGGSLEGVQTRGANSTSIDAFLVAQTKSGRRRAYLLEWKYVESYLTTLPVSKGEGRSGDTRRERYAPAFYAPWSSFRTDAGLCLDDFFYDPFYQILRQRLLADRMVHERELGVDEAKVVVVVPECNWAYRMVSLGGAATSRPLAQRFPQCETVEALTRSVLKEPDAQFAMVAPLSLLEAVARCLPAETDDWARYWVDRYGA